MTVSLSMSARGGVLLALLSLLMLGGCASKIQPLTGPSRQGDLLAASREWRQQTSVPAARDRLTEALRGEDDSHGRMERQVARANADKSWHVPDSIASLPMSQRARTGIFLVLGFKQKTGNKPLMVRTIVEDLRSKGWHARLVELGEWSSPEKNAKIIDEMMRSELPKVDRAVMVGFSKGGLDWAHWVQNQAPSLPLSQRQKIRLSLQFAPILRGSAAAKWMSEAGGPVAGFLRGKLRKERVGEEQRQLNDVASIANDPWVEHDMPVWRDVLPKLMAVHYVAIPDDPHGRPSMPKKYRMFSMLVNHDFRWSGPMDGLVESAAQVFPPGETTPQWVVRVRGSHMILDGAYVEGGGLTSKVGRLDDDEGWRGGLEVMDDLLRALPRSAAGW